MCGYVFVLKGGRKKITEIKSDVGSWANEASRLYRGSCFFESSGLVLRNHKQRIVSNNIHHMA